MKGTCWSTIVKSRKATMKRAGRLRAACMFQRILPALLRSSASSRCGVWVKHLNIRITGSTTTHKNESLRGEAKLPITSERFINIDFSEVINIFYKRNRHLGSFFLG